MRPKFFVDFFVLFKANEGEVLLEWDYRKQTTEEQKTRLKLLVTQCKTRLVITTKRALLGVWSSKPLCRSKRVIPSVEKFVVYWLI